MRQILFLGLTLLLACNGPKKLGSMSSSSKTASSNSPMEKSDMKAEMQAEVKTLPAVQVIEDERPLAPSNINGSYLHCEAKSAASSSEKTVACALRDLNTAKNIPLANYRSHAWAFVPSAGINVVTTELPADNAFQAEFRLSSSSPEILERTLNFRLDLVNQQGENIALQAPVRIQFMRWLSLNGAKLPDSSVIAGKEGEWNLYVCRMHIDGEVWIGKMIWNEFGPYSICYVAKGGTSIASNDPTAGTLNHPSDVLLAEDGHSWEDNLVWLPKEKLDDSLIFDAGGKSIPCRLTWNGGIPGIWDRANNQCVHEIHGAFQSDSYEVLQWKNKDFKEAFEAG